ncbi:hypothetical protein OVA24_06050 [Luteolibacter sp. SL250]|uniref:hypothetical protein n=1 Tax=Luteolibacter sp. SL250 TaxID=2995170 RepID=UPI00227102DD|nr:hypothetical protein [Luteolibacter sp. SL250]WAC20942.1 hypothetical protein OVA24_06050 [Luteolibacter sp. SL250]
MKTAILVYLSSLLVCLGQEPKLPEHVEFPASGDPVKFHQEVKDYIIYSSQVGLNVDRNSSITRRKIEEDSRDWEAPLAEIIGDPRQYEMGATEVALLAATIRKDRNDPRITAAAIRLLQEAVGMSIERIDRQAIPRVISGSKSWVGTLIRELVDLESPETLQAILIFLHSPEVDRLEILQQYTPKYIPPALQKFGDLRNAEEALKVAAKLESIGRVDVATDIKRAAERIQKETGRKQGPTGAAAGSSKNTSAPDGEAKDSADGTPLWPWLAAGGALIAALAAYFRMKRGVV